MPAIRRVLFCACLVAASVQSPGHAAAARDKEAVEAQAPQQAENVRLDYAQVLNVEPVYETLNAKRSELVCDEIKVRPKSADVQDGAGEGRLSRWWRGFKGWFGGGGDDAAAQAAPEAKATAQAAKPRCRSVPKDVQLRQPIAYDVDYMYRGMKFRARLPEDPGNRLRIRLSVAPYGVSSQALEP